MNVKKIAILTSLFFFVTYSSASAQSDYVLPYPSSMPGSKFYLLEQLAEKLKLYWYYGDFGSFTYDLSYADKYLVESKTLFEYGQIKLGADALEKSNRYFSKLEGDLVAAEKNGKDVSEKSALFHSAIIKHKEILTNLKQTLPNEVTWIEENRQEDHLPLHKLLDNSISLRK